MLEMPSVPPGGGMCDKMPWTLWIVYSKLHLEKSKLNCSKISDQREEIADFMWNQGATYVTKKQWYNIP